MSSGRNENKRKESVYIFVILKLNISPFNDLVIDKIKLIPNGICLNSNYLQHSNIFIQIKKLHNSTGRNRE